MKTKYVIKKITSITGDPDYWGILTTEDEGWTSIERAALYDDDKDAYDTLHLNPQILPGIYQVLPITIKK